MLRAAPSGLYGTRPNRLDLRPCVPLPVLLCLTRSCSLPSPPFRQASWDDVELGGLADYTADAEAVDPRMMALNVPLLEAMIGAPELLAWLRTLTSDRDFVSSIEIAMGKSEMECPPEVRDTMVPMQTQA
jgi:hypothetical protein